MASEAGMYEWIKREELTERIYMEVDGFWVWSPNKNGGYLNEYALTKMAEYLAARNAFWNWQINNNPAVGGAQSDARVQHRITCKLFPDPFDERNPVGPCTCGAETESGTRS